MGDDTSVQVALRIRPLLPREVIDSCKICTSVTPDQPQVFIGGNHAFTYDHVFDVDSRQDVIYQTVSSDLVESCLDGYNATILAYGQTGSGKTFTMGTGFEVEALNRPEVTENQGIIPRAVVQIFSSIEDRRKKCISEGHNPPDFRIICQFIEIYNEDIVDLLETAKPDYSDFTTDSARTRRNAIKIHENQSGEIYLVGVSTKPVNTASDAMKILRNGALSRTTGSTNMNDQSSRSHAIFTLTITVQRVVGSSGGAPELETLTGKFNFVDLAGSERLKRTGAVGDRAKEGININCGLLSLGNVISALADKTKKSSHVPYRDSKLTRLLQDSLGGNSKTLMIACVSPCDRDFVETINSMKYANRAKNIKNKVVLNQDKASRTIAILKMEIEQLTQELAEYKQGKRTSETGEFSDAHNENVLLSSEISSLRARVKAQQETIKMLTVKNSELLAQKTSSNWESTDVTSVVQSYMEEIEDLKAKLCESEATFEEMKKKPNRISNSNFGGSVSDLISMAKREVMMEQRSSSDDDESSGEDEEESDDYNKELADVTNEITIKQRLIEQLELSQQRMESLRECYEAKLHALQNKMKATEEERDRVLADFTVRSAPLGKFKQVKEDYEKKLNEMAAEVKRFQSAQREHIKQQRLLNSNQIKLQSLKSDLENMKRLKVKLMNQMKDETSKHRLESVNKNKEIAQLKKDQRKKENLIKTLENDRRMKELVIKRKYEELNVLKNRNNRKKFSPVKTKAKWTELNRNLNKNVSLKTTVDNFEREMLNLIEERGNLEFELKEVDDLEIAENIKANIVYLNDKISELQESILVVNSEKEEYEGFEVWGEEAAYLLKKMYELTYGSRVEINSLARKNDELEGTVHSQQQELSTLRDLMQYMLTQKSTDDPFAVDITAHLNNFKPDARQNAAAEETAQQSSRKARRLTSTTKELLGEVPPNRDDHLFVNPNNLPGLSRAQTTRSSARLLSRRDTYSILPDVLPTGEDAPNHKPKANNSTNNLNTTFTVKSPNLDTTFLDDVTPPGSPNSRRRSDVFNRLTGGSGINSLHIGTIKCLRAVSPRVLLTNTHVAEGHSRAVLSLYATNDKLFTGSKDTTSKVFDLTTGKEVTTLHGNPTNVNCVIYSEEHNVVLTASSCYIKIFDLRDKNPLIKTLISSGSVVEEPDKQEYKLEIPRWESKITAMIMAKNKLYTNFNEKVRIWDLRVMSYIGILNGRHSSHVMCLAAGQNMMVSGSKDHYVKVYDLAENNLKGTLEPPHYDGIECLALSRNTLISGSRDTCIKKWDLDRMELIHSNNTAHSNWITGLTFAPSNENIFLSTCRDGCIKIWNVDTMRELSKVEVCKGPINCICINSRFAFTGTNQGAVKLWRWNDNKYRNDVMTMSTGHILDTGI